MMGQGRMEWTVMGVKNRAGPGGPELSTAAQEKVPCYHSGVVSIKGPGERK